MQMKKKCLPAFRAFQIWNSLEGTWKALGRHFRQFASFNGWLFLAHGASNVKELEGTEGTFHEFCKTHESRG
jgi:hypothetical protein